ncbi:MAG: manganese efflux pump, partial [Proteobacteria bacterium]|nr:manganese efflux pump [Pseudomonadota bacterium]
FSMSMDAFAASLGKGAALGRPRASEVIRTGVIFGLIEAATPVIGWAIGAAAATWVGMVDHWLAFAILGVLGVHMCHAAWRGGEHRPTQPRQSIGILITTAIATSLDAMAVGVTLAFVNVSIIAAAAAIGLATGLMTTIGTYAGRWLGPAFGRGAEFIGGLCLIGIGVKILIEHTLGG